MRNLHKLLIVLISVAFIGSGVMAQTDISPQLKNQMEKKAKTASPDQSSQVMGNNAPTDAELTYQTDLGYWSVPGQNSNSVFNTLVFDAKMLGDESASTELIQNATNPPNYKPITLNIDGTIAYAYVAYDASGTNPNGPATFDTDDPGTISSLGSQTSNDFIAGGSWADDVWYGVEYGTSQLYTMDVSSGVMTAVGTASNAGFNGMAYDPSTSTMFAATGDVLYTVDLTTGAATMVGTIQTAGNLIIGLACSDGGELYGTDIVSDVLYSIDPATGAGTIVGPLGIDISYAQGLEYDNENGVLYASAYTTQGELYTIDPGTAAATLVGAFQGGAEMCALAFPYSAVSYDDDLGIQSIIDPSTGVDLTATEAVTVRVKNYGTNPQSNFDVWFTLDGGAAVTETISATLNGGETMDHTFATTVDLSAYGTYVIYAYVELTGDENPDNNDKEKTVENLAPSLCFPTYSSGCVVGDGITDFAVEQISNLANGCEDNTGFTGCSQYLGLGPAILFPGGTHTFTLGTGYSTQHTNIWIDFNDDLVLDADELILYNYIIENANQLYDVDVTLPADAEEGLHVMRVMAVWITEFTDPCGSYSYGESEDYYVNVGVAAYGNLNGTVTVNTGGAALEGAVVSVANGNYTTTTASDGTYEILDILTGDWDISVMADGYNPTYGTVTITEGNTTTEDFAMLAPTMDIDPLAVDVIIDPESTLTETINILNDGDGELMWTADLELLTKSGGKIYGVTGYSKDVIGGEETVDAEVIAVGTPVPVDQLKNLNVPLKTSAYFDETPYPNNYPESTDETEIIGSDANGYSAGPRNRGNLFTCTVDKNLIEFMGWHDVTVNPTQMWLLLYESDVQAGTYTLVSASDISPAPVGLGWCSSGVINYPLVAGKYYMMTASFEQACGYYNDQAVTPFPYPVAFGEATAGAGWDYAPPAVFPPNATEEVPATAFADPTLYYQQLVTGDGGAIWLEIDTDEGTLAAGADEDMTLSFSSVDIPAGTIKTAEITFFSDPDVGTVTVPVSMTVGDQDFGYIEGNVMLSGNAPYNWEDVENVLVEAGPYMAYPDASGDYQVTAYPGTYDVTATLFGYETQTVPGVVVGEGLTVTGIDFDMPATYGRVMGTVTDVDSGDPIEDAIVVIVDTEYETTTAADGTYEIVIDAGTYNVWVNHATYAPQTAVDVEVMAQDDTEQDFELTYAESCEFSVVLWDDYGDGWNGNTLTILVDGVEVLSNIGLAAGTGPETWYFETSSGSEVVCEYVGTAAQWDYENSYYIYDNDDNEVFSDGLGGVPPVGGSFTSTCIVFIYGDLAGTVTESATGDPIEGAEIMIDDLVGYTLSDGTYLIEGVMIGTWDVYCEAVGYNPEMASGVVILEEQVTTQDFALMAPEFTVDPLTVSVTLEPNAMADEVVTISNPGGGSIDWSAAIIVIEDDGGTDDMFDLIWEVPVGVGGGEAGLETNGTYIYTTKWNGTGEYYRYGMDGTYIEQITVAGASGTRDMAYDGTYFYGGAASPTVFELDLDNASLISTFTAPTDCRAIAYNEDEGVFYANNWGSNITAFDHTGANMGDFPVGPVGDSYYGFAYDGYTDGAPYLWGHAQVGTNLCELVQIGLPGGAETGLTFDAGSLLSAADLAGGLAIDDHISPGLWAFLGTCQNVNLWTIELGPAGPVWLTIDPTSGTLAAGATEDMDLHFDATELLPGVYEAEIHFSTDPNVGEPVVEVTMTVEGLIPAINLMAMYECTDVMLTWEMPTGGNPDSWKIYRDGTEIDDVTSMEYTDMMVDPEVDYEYTVTAVYAGVESQPSSPAMINVPTPEDLEALDIEALADTPNENDVTVTWAEPDACLAPDSYSIYRDNTMIADGVTGLEYVDGALSAGFYEYYVVAVYYFGESAASDPAYVLITGVEDYDASLFQIYPNPATELVNVKSPVSIDRIYVLNNSGQLVVEEEVNNMEYQINVSRYEAGIYFIKLETSEGIILRKVAVK